MTRRAATRIDLLWLALILAGHALVWWLHPFAHLDDLDSQHYARLAAELLAGDFELASHPFNDRFGVTVPSAALYAVFGISARTIALWPLVASLVTIAAVYFVALRCFGPSSAWLSALLLASNPVQVEYAAHLLPDIVASAFMCVSLGLLLAARDPDRPSPRPALLGALSTLTLFAGFLSKTTVVWAFPFLLGLLVLDLARRRHASLWTSVLVTGFVCIGLFLVGYQLATGDPLHALGSIEGSHNVSVASFDGKASAKIAYRLKWAPIDFLGKQLGYASLIVLAVPGLVHLVWPLRHLPRSLRPFAAYFVVVLLSFWFGSTSLSAYNPLPVSARFLMPLLAPLAILGGVTLARVVLEGEREPEAGGVRAGQWLLAGTFLLAGALAWPREARVALYVGLGLALVWLTLGLGPAWFARALRLAVWLAVSLGVLAYYQGDGEVKEPNPLRGLQHEFVREQLAELPPGKVVFTDDHSAFVLPLMLERLGLDPVELVDWSDAEAVRARQESPSLAFVDQTTLSMMYEWLGRDIPGFAIEAPVGWRLVARSPTLWRGSSNVAERYFRIHSLLLYELDDPVELLAP